VEERPKARNAGMGTQEIRQQRIDGIAPEGLQRNLPVARAFHPVCVELRAEVRQQQAARGQNAIHEGREKLGARIVDPVQIFHQHDTGLPARLGLDDAAHRTEQASLHRGPVLHQGPLGIRDAEEVEEHRQPRLEFAVEQQQRPGDLLARFALPVALLDAEVRP
jgi:hypothetical protein